MLVTRALDLRFNRNGIKLSPNTPLINNGPPKSYESSRYLRSSSASNTGRCFLERARRIIVR